MPNAVVGGLSTAIWMLAGYTATSVAAARDAPMRFVRGSASSTPDVSSDAPLSNVQNLGAPGTQLGTILSNGFGATKCSTPMKQRKPARTRRERLVPVLSPTDATPAASVSGGSGSGSTIAIGAG